MSGTPFMFCMSRSRVNGCSGSTDSAELFLMKATPTTRGPALTGIRALKRWSSVSFASARFVSDSLLSASPPTGAVNTRSPSIEISSVCGHSSPGT